MSGFKRIFEDYGGNYETTMSRFLNNESMYMRFLDMLFQDENLQRLKESLECNDIQSAFDAAHTLKGVVGNMGLVPLFDAVNEIVEPLRQKENRSDYMEMYQKIEQEFKKAARLQENLKKEA